MPKLSAESSLEERKCEPFLSTYLETFVRPRPALARLVRARNEVQLGTYAVSVTALTYLFVYFFLSRNGGRPTVFTPWLAIPAEDYYRYNLVLIVPSLALAWVSAAGFFQIVARALGGSGTFETTLSVTGWGIGVASWATGLHDLVSTFLGYVGRLDQRAYEDAMSTPGNPAHQLIWSLMVAYALWFLTLFFLGAKAGHGLSGGRAFLPALAGFCVYQAVFAIFNR